MTSYPIELDYITDDLNDMSVAHNYNQWIISMIKQYLGQSILEVGAGSGTFSSYLLIQDKTHLLSLEPSQTPYQILSKKIRTFNTDHISCKQCFSSELQSESKFNSVVYNNVLEHIEYDINELKVAHKLVKSGGYVIVYSPALPQLMSNFDKSIGHYHRYTLSEIKHKFEEANLQVVRSQYVDFIGTFLWYLKFKLLKSNKLGSNNVQFFDKYIVPIQRNIESRITIPFGKNVLCIGRKK